MMGFMQRSSPEDDGAVLLQITNGSFLRRVRKLAELLGVASLQMQISTHSASEMSKCNIPLQDIMLFGRWQCTKSAQKYIRKGVVAVTRTKAFFNQQMMSRLDFWSSLLSTSWLYYDLFHVQLELWLSLTRMTDKAFATFEAMLKSLPSSGDVGDMLSARKKG
eukprot:TRINITY_DN88303_c0_g1_i1.p1 TRINITY_DN88303_c0_g1~~TRINITY_DN88303_c0_g1_i1.p1  ORF type:complete len:163 (+),score=21.60 TRINITY_DN88303_c0_g1_i1:364-852(+)